MVWGSAADRKELVMYYDWRLDDAEQKRIRDKILVPQFYRPRSQAYTVLDKPEHIPLQKRGMDTVAYFYGIKHTIEEKIVGWPFDKDTQGPAKYPYDAFCCEYESNGKPSWMIYSEAMILLYCFCNLEKTALKCFWIDMPLFKAWYAENGHRYPGPKEYTEKTKHALSRMVKIRDVLRDVPAKWFILRSEAQWPENCGDYDIAAH